MELKRWLGIGGIGMGLALQSSNWILTNISLSAIQKEFSVGILTLQWIVNSFGLLSCTLLILMGRLADLFGRKRLYSIGFLIALGGSVLTGLAPKPSWIIVGQGCWGVASAILMPVSQVLMLHAFPHKERGRAIGLWAATISLSFTISLLFGGFVIHALSWRWIFFIFVPLLLLGLLLTTRFVHESKQEKERGKIDFAGAFLLLVGSASLVLCIMHGPEWGWLSPWTLLLALLFLLASSALIYVEKRVSSPILELSFFSNRPFVINSVAIFCLVFLVWTVFFLFPLYFQTTHGDTPLKAGLMMLFLTIPMALGAPLAGKLYQRWGAKLLLTAGFLFLLLSLLLQFFLEPHSGFGILIAASLAFGVGFALISGPSTVAALSSLPKNKAGLAAGCFSTMQEIGGTIGLACAGTLFRLGHPLFMHGFHNALYTLVVVAIIGFLASLSLNKLK